MERTATKPEENKGYPTGKGTTLSSHSLTLPLQKHAFLSRLFITPYWGVTALKTFTKH